MATFPSIAPKYGQQKRSAPNTRRVRFADGYEHRILFGLAEHQNPKIFNLTFLMQEQMIVPALLLHLLEKQVPLNLFVNLGLNQYHI